VLFLLGQHGRHDYLGEPPPHLMKMFKDFLERFKAAGLTRVPFMRPKTEGDGDSYEEEDASEDDDEAVIRVRRSKRLRVLRADRSFLNFFIVKKSF